VAETVSCWRSYVLHTYNKHTAFSNHSTRQEATRQNLRVNEAAGQSKVTHYDVTTDAEEDSK